MNINTKFSAIAASVIALGGVAASAHAQSSGVSRPFTLKLGAYTPSDQATRDFSGDTHFLLGATYEFGRVPDSPLVYGAYADYIFQTSRTTPGIVPDGDGGFLDTDITDRVSAYGVGLEARFLLPTSGVQGYGRPRHSEGLRPYIGGGLGFYGAMGKETLERFDASESKTTTGLGGKVMIGVQSRSGFLGEVSYHWIPTVSIPEGDDLDLSGYGFSLGYRF